MYPVINIFGKLVTLYAIMVIIGILVIFIYLHFKLKGENDYKYIMTLLFASIGAVIGSHLLYGLTNISFIIKLFSHLDIIDSFKTFFSIFRYVFGGSVYYGGLIGGLIGGFLYLKISKNKDKQIVDLLVPIIPLFHAFGRIGCFLVGCCYGVESKFGFTYTHSLVELANGVNRFPVQLVEAFCEFMLFLILNYLLKHEKCKNKLLYIYLISYGIIRFGLEFLRGDSYRGFIGILSTSQLISILIILFSIFMLYKYQKKSKDKLYKMT